MKRLIINIDRRPFGEEVDLVASISKEVDGVVVSSSSSDLSGDGAGLIIEQDDSGNLTVTVKRGDL